MDNSALPQNQAMWGWLPESGPEDSSSPRPSNHVQTAEGISIGLHPELAEEFAELLRLQAAVIDHIAKSKGLKVLLYGHSDHYRTTPELPSWLMEPAGSSAP